MRFILILLFALPATAGEIRVIDRVPEPQIDVPANLTEAEFRAWAEKYNANQLKAAKKRYKAYLKERGPLYTVEHFEAQTGETTKVGGGYGAGGFGGAGGYLGYGTNIDGLAGGNAFAYDTAASQGNSIRRDGTRSEQRFKRTYRDLNDNGGGPVTFINPFCYEHYAR